MFMFCCLKYPEEGLIVLIQKRSICFVVNKKMLNPTKLLLIALIWFCKSTSLPKLKQVVGKSFFRCFIYVFVLLCCISCCFYWFMLMKATLWFTAMHTFMGNGPKLADWSKQICLALWSCFCSLLTSNSEVNTGDC